MNRATTTWAFTDSIVIRLFGVVYLIAFLSLWPQIDGLIGSQGILPAAEFLEHVRTYASQHGRAAVALAPTLAWCVGASDTALHALCAAGTLAALLVIAGLLPGPLLALLWLLYLSLTVVGQTFLGFQWENLLLESGLIAVALAPPKLRMSLIPAPPPAEPAAHKAWHILLAAPSAVARWLLGWLLFRLMLQSGLVKLASNDDVWWNFTALTCHYWTQPLPTWTSYYANLLPHWFQKLSVALTYIVELALPFLIVWPRRARLIAFWGFTTLMILISLTGNYTYFTLLTFVLALTLVDDRHWPQRWRAHGTAPGRFEGRDGSPTCPPKPCPALRSLPAKEGRRRSRPPGSLIPIRDRTIALLRILALLLYAGEALPITVFYLHATTHRFVEVANQRLDLHIPSAAPQPGPALLRRLSRWEPLRAINSYGLFANMTENRPEIVIEGSQDGVTWQPYEFRYKPGELTHRPRFVQPHQPRLDWQMWFAALGRIEDNPWLVRLLDRMLRGTPTALALLASNPFPDTPPRYLRATRWEYRFAAPAEKSATAQWWTRSDPQPYTPVLTLRDGKLAVAE